MDVNELRERTLANESILLGLVGHTLMHVDPGVRENAVGIIFGGVRFECTGPTEEDRRAAAATVERAKARIRAIREQLVGLIEQCETVALAKLVGLEEAKRPSLVEASDVVG